MEEYIDLKPGEAFIKLIEEETNFRFTLEQRWIEGAKIWKPRHKCGVPFANFYSFRDAYYKKLKRRK